MQSYHDYVRRYSFLSWFEASESDRIPESAIKVHLPKVEQTTGYTCGCAALRAICSHYGVGPATEEEYEDLLDANDSDGTKPANIIRVARGLGLHVLGRQNMTIEELKTRLERKIPVICTVQAWGSPRQYQKNNNGHYIVAIGYDDVKIYFEDPSLKKTRGFLPYQQFLDRWHDEDGDGNKLYRYGIAIWSSFGPRKKTAVTGAMEVK